MQPIQPREMMDQEMRTPAEYAEAKEAILSLYSILANAVAVSSTFTRTA